MIMQDTYCFNVYTHVNMPASVLTVHQINIIGILCNYWLIQI